MSKFFLLVGLSLGATALRQEDNGRPSRGGGKPVGDSHLRAPSKPNRKGDFGAAPVGPLPAVHASQEVGYLADCQIGMGYSYTAKRCRQQAFKAVDQCAEGEPLSDTCLIVEAMTPAWNNYNHKVSDSSDYSDLIDIVTSAEGTGWGVSLSMSANYMSQRESSAHSVSFYVGASGDVGLAYYQNPAGLVLSTEASAALWQDPQNFIDIYGVNYVYKIITSTSFIGSVNIDEKQTSESSSLGVMASVKISELMAGVSVEFNKEYSENHSHLDMTISSVYTGQIVPYDVTIDGIIAMGEVFNQWQNNVHDVATKNMHPTRMVYRSYLDVPEVIAAINHITDADKKADILRQFQLAGPSSNMLQMVSKEFLMTKADQKMVENMLQWPCVRGDYKLKETVQQVEAHIRAHIEEMETRMDESKFGLLNSWVLRGNMTWFAGVNGDWQEYLNKQFAGVPGHCAQLVQTSYQNVPHSHTSHDCVNTCEFPLPSNTKRVEIGQNTFSFENDAQLLTGITLRHDVPSSRINEMMLHGADIGFQYLTFANISSSSIVSHHIYDYQDVEMSVMCPAGMFVQGIEIDWLPIQAHSYSHQCKDDTGNFGAMSLEECARTTKGPDNGCGNNNYNNEFMWSPGYSATSPNWGCRCCKKSNDYLSNSYWNIYRAIDVLENPNAYASYIHLRCTTLDLTGSFGLDTSGSNPHYEPDQVLTNYPGQTTSAQCPRGSLVNQLDVTTTNSAMSSNHGPYMSSIGLKCRKIVDFMG